MHINISTVDSGWILQKISQNILKYNPFDDVTFEVSHEPDYLADCNFYVDIQCYLGQKTKLDVCYFTHVHENNPEWIKNYFYWNKVWQNVDGIVSMNKRYTDMLIENGYNSTKLTTITPGAISNFHLKPIKIGIVSRGGHPGYGDTFINNFLRNYELSNFEFYFLGSQWDTLEQNKTEFKTKVVIVSNEDYDFYPKFYHNIDFLLIPGLWTAGPMSMQEALASGIPIIGADVGFVNYEFQADYVFEPGNTKQLYDILKNIELPILNRRKQVEHLNWEDYTRKLVSFIKKL